MDLKYHKVKGGVDDWDMMCKIFDFMEDDSTVLYTPSYLAKNVGLSEEEVFHILIQNRGVTFDVTRYRSNGKVIHAWRKLN